MKSIPSLTALAFTLGSIGCASTNPSAARQELADELATRAGLDDVVSAEREDESLARVRERVDQLLDQPLSMDGALRIALLNNRSFLTTVEELGVAQADLVEAGLLENPVIGGDLVSSTIGNGLGGGLGLSQSLLSAFLVPAKRRLAKARLQVAVLQVTDASLALVRDVRIAYANAQAAVASAGLHRTLVQVAEVADELAQRQHEAGNLTDLDRERFAAALDEARMELSDHQLEVTTTREELNMLLGLWGPQVEWTLTGPLPDPGAGLQGIELGTLEQVGIRQRLDISAARFQVESMQRAIELRRRGVIPEVEVGIEARNEVGNDAGHEWVLGPSLSIELPLFNPGHADFARLRAQLRQAQHQLQQTSIEARSHIRLHREQLVVAQRRAGYMADVVLPRRQTISARALEHYNGMLIGAYDLFDVRAEQIRAQQDHVDAVRDYWVARSELERAVGGRLPE